MRAFVVGLVAEELNPATERPVPLSGLVFTLVALATALLLVSMVRHLRRVANGPLADDSRQPRPAAGGVAGAVARDAEPGGEPPAEPRAAVPGAQAGPAAGAGTLNGPAPEGDGPA